MAWPLVILAAMMAALGIGVEALAGAGTPLGVAAGVLLVAAPLSR